LFGSCSWSHVRSKVKGQGCLCVQIVKHSEGNFYLWKWALQINWIELTKSIVTHYLVQAGKTFNWPIQDPSPHKYPGQGRSLPVSIGCRQRWVQCNVLSIFCVNVRPSFCYITWFFFSFVFPWLCQGFWFLLLKFVCVLNSLFLCDLSYRSGFWADINVYQMKMASCPRVGWTWWPPTKTTFLFHYKYVYLIYVLYVQ